MIGGVIIERLPLWLASTNCWIVAPTGAGGECVIVDAPPDPEAILARLGQLDLTLVAMIVTHGHVDHVGGIGGVAESTPGDLPVHLHPADHHMLADPAGASGSLGQLADLQGIDFGDPEMLVGLDDGVKVSGAGMTFTAVHTPGHTPGSTCFVLETPGDGPVLFSGDHLFAGSVGRWDLPGGDLEQLVVSMVQKILPMPDEVRVLPGHGPETTIGAERASNPFLAQVMGRSGPG